MSSRMQRARLLLGQSRFELAERELRGALVESPGSPEAHALLAFCLARLERPGEARAEAEEAVRLAPDWSFGHYVLADALTLAERYRAARDAIMEAIRLDPEDPDHFATLAQIHIGLERWGEALHAAEQGLALDPHHVGCANLRSLALVRLGRREEAGAALESTLARDPENALTHANLGWERLHAGDHRSAVEHFGEALRRDPELEWARDGLLEALKARNPVYGLLLRAFLWMSRLRRELLLLIVFGAVLLARGVKAAGDAYPALQPVTLPLLALYFVFAFLCWTADPLFTLTVRLHPQGRLMLDRDEIRASNLVVLCLVAAAVTAGAGLVTGRLSLLAGAFPLVVLAIPVAATFQLDAGWRRRTLGGCSVVILLFILLGLFMALGPRDALADPDDDPAFVLFAFALFGMLPTLLIESMFSLRRPRG